MKQMDRNGAVSQSRRQLSGGRKIRLRKIEWLAHQRGRTHHHLPHLVPSFFSPIPCLDAVAQHSQGSHSEQHAHLQQHSRLHASSAPRQLPDSQSLESQTCPPTPAKLRPRTHTLVGDWSDSVMLYRSMLIALTCSALLSLAPPPSGLSHRTFAHDITMPLENDWTDLPIQRPTSPRLLLRKRSRRSSERILTV